MHASWVAIRSGDSRGGGLKFSVGHDEWYEWLTEAPSWPDGSSHLSHRIPRASLRVLPAGRSVTTSRCDAGLLDVILGHHLEAEVGPIRSGVDVCHEDRLQAINRRK